MPTYEIDGPDGKTYQIDGPAGATREQIIARVQSQMGNGQNGPAPAAAAAPQAPAVSPVADVIRSIPGGISKGLAGIAGLPGDLNGLLTAGANAGMKLIGLPPVPEGYGKPATAMPTSADLNSAISKPFGGYYEPKTKAGEYAQTIASFAPNAIAPGSAMARAARVVIPGAASEAAGQATKGQKYEGVARAGGALLGGIGEGLGEGLLLKAPKAPTLAELNDMKTKAYQAADQAGVVIDPKSFSQFAADLGTDITKNNVVQADIHKNALSALNVIQDEAASGAPLTLARADAIRQAVNGAIEKASGINGSNADLRIATKIKSGLDNYLDNLRPTDTLAGDASVAVPILKEARGLARRQFKGEEIQKLIDLAENSASTNYSASGYEQALRAQFKNLNAKFIKDPNLAKTFSDSERAAIAHVAKGGALENGLRWLGKFSPGGPVSSGMAAVVGGGGGAALGNVIGGPMGGAIGGAAGAAALGGTGALARIGATALTDKNARTVSDLVRSGAELTKPQVGHKLLQDLLLSQAAHR